MPAEVNWRSYILFDAHALLLCFERYLSVMVLLTKMNSTYFTIFEASFPRWKISPFAMIIIPHDVGRQRRYRVQRISSVSMMERYPNQHQDYQAWIRFNGLVHSWIFNYILEHFWFWYKILVICFRILDTCTMWINIYIIGGFFLWNIQEVPLHCSWNHLATIHPNEYVQSEMQNEETQCWKYHVWFMRHDTTETWCYEEN